ncbi:Uncharacterized protein APZ42_031857 [Daphnia magna]|uniref:Uncharacterized protein n=1 Tax=Daphnia magna TaxID=35525 RepID=A0A164MH43_9CRUS|nr:Uncharacterized protein APZ42_031857 [Daphnia magna]
MSGKPKRDARLHDIVDAIDISETQQHLIDEEDTDVAEETSEEVEADMLRKDPPGEPIPAFTIQSWKASWRRAFFTDWRWSKRKEGEAQVWARCKTGQCQMKTNPHYYAGGKSSFTNFEKHLNSCHKEEYKQYNPVSSKDLNQPSLLSFNVQPTKTTKQRQIKLDTELALKFAVDNIPLNILRRPRFRQWVESGMNGYQLAGIDRMRNKVAMVKTDGGSNMVANIFVNNIPGWNDEDQFSIEIQSYIRPWHQQEQALFKEKGVSNEMMEAAVQDVEKKGEFQDVEVKMEEMMPSTDSIPCGILPLTATHKLQLVIKDGFKALVGEAALVISHVSKLINYVRKSVLDTEMVFNAVGFCLTAKNATRWNSTYFMMMKFLRAIDKDPTLCSRLNAVKKHGSLTAFQLVVLREIVFKSEATNDSTFGIELTLGNETSTV